jgi:Ca2+-binding RTX toxin-like protein
MALNCEEFCADTGTSCLLIGLELMFRHHPRRQKEQAASLTEQATLRTIELTGSSAESATGAGVISEFSRLIAVLRNQLSPTRHHRSLWRQSVAQEISTMVEHFECRALLTPTTFPFQVTVRPDNVTDHVLTISDVTHDTSGNGILNGSGKTAPTFTLTISRNGDTTPTHDYTVDLVRSGQVIASTGRRSANTSTVNLSLVVGASGRPVLPSGESNITVRLIRHNTSPTPDQSADLATVIVRVNQDPSTQNQSFTVFERSSLNSLDLGVSDPDGESVTVRIDTLPAGGLLFRQDGSPISAGQTLNSNVDTVFYTPDSGTTGSDSFTFSASDSVGGLSATRTAFITLEAPPAGLLVVSTAIDELDSDFSDGDFSLREAIAQSNLTADVNTINFSPGINGTEVDLTLGQLSIIHSVNITGNGATQTIIDAQLASRIFSISAGSLFLSNIAIKNGRTTGQNNGGAVLSTTSETLTIVDSVISGSGTTGTGADGGAVHSGNGPVIIDRTTFSGNSTTGNSSSGGALSALGEITIRNSTFSGNSTGGSSAFGGAIASLLDQNITITNSTLSGNRVLGTGSHGGGAIFFDDGDVKITNSTITGNTANIGGGIGIYADDAGESLQIHNSIVAGNTAPTNPDFTAPGSPEVNLEVRNSLIGRSDGTTLSATTGRIADGEGNFIGGITGGTAINPLLSPLASNGGPTQTHALLVESLAFNSGNNSLAVDLSNASSPLTLDQRGVGFPRVWFGTVDMGALESRVLDGTSGADAFTLTYGTTTAGNVAVTVSSNGGPTVDLGTFPMNLSLTIRGLGGADSVRVVGTSGIDTFTVAPATKVVVNGANLLLDSIESRRISGMAGNDLYKFDVDSSLGLFSLDESGGGIDTIDFALTSTVGVTLNLGIATTQTVHSTNLSLNLNSATHFERVVGGTKNDILTGNSLANTLNGNSGIDTLNGMSGSDSLVGAGGNDTYVFTATSIAETDTLTEVAGGGRETLDFSSLIVPVNMNLSSVVDQLAHANRTIRLNAVDQFENVIGGTKNDILTGNSLANVLTGNVGNDTLNGAGGNDTLAGGLGNDTYAFDAATTLESDSLSEGTTDGIDTLSFVSLTTPVTINLGSSALQTVSANRTLKLNSSVPFEHVQGGAGNDSLTGNAAANMLLGNGGNDRITGAAGNDSLTGGPGDDVYVFAPATAAEADFVVESASGGTDTLDFGLLASPVILNLGTGVVQAVHTNRTLQLNSTTQFENAAGGSGDDVLTGNAIANILVGNAGSDQLLGNGARDIVIGGLGLDTINGGDEEDIVISGTTSHDAVFSNLNDLRTTWILTTISSTSRMAALRAGVGPALASLRKTVNVLNDAGEDDLLTGGTGSDWYFRAIDDVLSDLAIGEFTDLL